MVGTLVPSLNGRSCNDKDGDLNSYLGSEFINLPSGQLVTSFFFLKKICLLFFFFVYLFYLASLGLSRGTQDLSPWRTDSLVCGTWAQ